MFEKFEGTSTTQSGRIEDWTITSGIGPEKGLDFQTTVGSYKDEDSEFYGAKAKFLKYFSFAAVYGNREGSETQDECEQICSKWSDKCCAGVRIKKEI